MNLRINTPDGHVWVCLFLVCLGTLLHAAGFQWGEKLVDSSLGAMLLAMQRSARNTATVEGDAVINQTEPPEPKT